MTLHSATELQEMNRSMNWTRATWASMRLWARRVSVVMFSAGMLGALRRSTSALVLAGVGTMTTCARQMHPRLAAPAYGVRPACYTWHPTAGVAHRDDLADDVNARAQ